MGAAYPTYTLISSSSADVDAGIVTARATNGALRARRMYAAEKLTLSLTHWLTPAEKAALLSHYTTNRDDSFAFTWPDDGVTRTCCYLNAPLVATAPQAGRFLVTVKLGEV